MPTWTEDTRRFLEARRVGHLATTGADGAPHVVPVCYALDDEALYFIADAKPKRRPARALQRLVNLRANPRAALALWTTTSRRSRKRWSSSLTMLPHARAYQCWHRSMPLSGARAKWPNVWCICTHNLSNRNVRSRSVEPTRLRLHNCEAIHITKLTSFA